MAHLKKPRMIPIVLTIVILLAAGFFIASLLLGEERLSESEIREQLESMYGGTVGKLSIKDDVYNAEMKRDGAVYSATIDAVSGRVLSLAQTEKKIEAIQKILSEAELTKMLASKYTGIAKRITLSKNEKEPVYDVEISQNQELIALEVDALSGEIISEKVKETTFEQALITKEQAVKIALGQLKGEVDDVSFEQTNDGGFYLIEIEGEEEDAEVQIHAITGKIISVVWDN